MYKERTLSEALRNTSEAFPVVLITGPRQVGKTTLLEHVAEPSRKRVTLDDLDERRLAQDDPALFLQTHGTPLIIDEVQYAPQLFSAMKQIVDRMKVPGLYWLTGSQKFHLMQGMSESLAGRVGILDLLGFSRTEIEDRALSSLPFVPNSAWLEHADTQSTSPITSVDIYENIWRGSYPAIINQSTAIRDVFFRSYVQTYIERDVRALARVGDELSFHRLLIAAAARTAQLLNYTEIARDVGIDVKTAKAWLSILEASGIVAFVQPYKNNVTNRLLKTPKLYFLDTGLCAFLTRWSSPETLEAGAMSGAIFETYAFTEIIKSYLHHGLVPQLYFYRDRDQREIDFLLERDGVLHPIEIKKSATPSTNASRHFDVLATLGAKVGHGAVISLRNQIVPLSQTVTAIPLQFL